MALRTANGALDTAHPRRPHQVFTNTCYSYRLTEIPAEQQRLVPVADPASKELLGLAGIQLASYGSKALLLLRNSGEFKRHAGPHKTVSMGRQAYLK